MVSCSSTLEVYCIMMPQDHFSRILILHSLYAACLSSTDDYHLLYPADDRDQIYRYCAYQFTFARNERWCNNIICKGVTASYVAGV